MALYHLQRVRQYVELENPPMLQATCDMCAITFYYLLCVGKYTITATMIVAACSNSESATSPSMLNHTQSSPTHPLCPLSLLQQKQQCTSPIRKIEPVAPSSATTSPAQQHAPSGPLPDMYITSSANHRVPPKTSLACTTQPLPKGCTASKLVTLTKCSKGLSSPLAWIRKASLPHQSAAIPCTQVAPWPCTSMASIMTPSANKVAGHLTPSSCTSMSKCWLSCLGFPPKCLNTLDGSTLLALTLWQTITFNSN